MDAERLRMERARRQLTVRQLAQKAGVNPGTVSELERGVREPYPATLGKIAAALDIPIEELSGAPLAEAPHSLELSFDNHLEQERRETSASILDELLTEARASTRRLALPEEDFRVLWKHRTAKERARINQELLEERRLIRPLVTRWTSMSASPERSELYQAWQTVLERMLTAVIENTEAAQREAEKARREGEETRAKEALREAEEFAGAA